MAIEKGIPREDVVKLISDKWKKWKEGRQAREDVWLECLDAFLSQFHDNSEVEEFRSQRYMPMIFEAVMNIMSQASRGLFPSDFFFTAQGDNHKAQEMAKVRAIYMQNRMEATDFREEYVTGQLFNLFVYGNAPAMLSWESRQSSAPEINYTDSEGQPQTYTSSCYAYDGPSFKSLDLFNFVADPIGGNDAGSIKIYRSLVTPEELKELAEPDEEGWSLYDSAQVKKAIASNEKPPKESSDSKVESIRQEHGITEPKEDTDKIELLWGCGNWPISGKLRKNYIVVVANRQYLLRCEPSPYKFGLSPLRLTTLIPLKGLKEIPYGLGVVESALGLIDVINVRSNQAIDSMALTLNPVYKAVDDGVIDLDDIVSAPGNVIPMADTKNLEALHPPMQAIQAYQEINLLKAELVDATFSYKNFGAQSHQKTATEVATSASLMATVTGRFVQRSEKDIKEILVFFDELEKQYYEQGNEVFARYQDQGELKFEQVTPEVIYQSYTWHPQGSGFTHLREVRLQQLFQAGIAAAQTPGVVACDWEEWIRATLTEMGRRDVDKLVPGAQEMFERAVNEGKIPPQILQAVLQTVQGGQGGAGGTAPGSNPPQGMAPPGRGAIPNAGGPGNLTSGARGPGMG